MRQAEVCNGGLLERWRARTAATSMLGGEAGMLSRASRPYCAGRREVKQLRARCELWVVVWVGGSEVQGVQG
jgi:hypothetical protein